MVSSSVRFLATPSLTPIFLSLQLQVQGPGLQEIPDPELHFRPVERFGNKIMCAHGKRPFPAPEVPSPGQDENGQIVVFGDYLAELVHDGDAIHVRHVQIQQDQVRREIHEYWYHLAGIVQAPYVVVSPSPQDGSQRCRLSLDRQRSEFGILLGSQFSNPNPLGPRLSS